MPILQNPATDSRNRQSWPRSSTRHSGRGAGAAGACAADAALTTPTNSRRESTLEPRRDKPVDGRRRVPELLVGREAVARLHLGDQPAVVADLVHRRANCRPVVIAQEDVGIDALIAAAPAMPEDIFQVNPRDARAVNFNPLFGEAGLVNVADVQVNADPWMVHVVQKLPELARCDEKSLFGAAILATDPDARLSGLLAQSFERF